MNLLESLRDIIGEADFYIENGNYTGSWDYGAMVEYLVAALLLLVVVSSIFKFIRSLCK